jgi:hypothetical protein
VAACAKLVLQSDGSYLVGVDPAITDLSTCAYVVETGGEFSLGSLMNLSPDDALVISVAVAGLWAVAWAFKQVIHAVNLNGNENVEIGS